jgi:hypothetical protein
MFAHCSPEVLRSSAYGRRRAFCIVSGCPTMMTWWRARVEIPITLPADARGAPGRVLAQGQFLGEQGVDHLEPRWFRHARADAPPDQEPPAPGASSDRPGSCECGRGPRGRLCHAHGREPLHQPGFAGHCFPGGNQGAASRGPSTGRSGSITAARAATSPVSTCAVAAARGRPVGSGPRWSGGARGWFVGTYASVRL